MKYAKKRALTLIELMLVIVLIGTIGTILSLNLRSALVRGKEFKTKQLRNKIEAVLNIALAEDMDVNTIRKDWPQIVEQSPLIKVKSNDGDIADAWGNPFKADYDSNLGQFKVYSSKIDPDGNILKEPSLNGQISP